MVNKVVVWNIFPYIGSNNPNWLIFFRGVETTNQQWSIWGWWIRLLMPTETGAMWTTDYGRKPFNAKVPPKEKHILWSWPWWTLVNGTQKRKWWFFGQFTLIWTLCSDVSELMGADVEVFRVCTLFFILGASTRFDSQLMMTIQSIDSTQVGSCWPMLKKRLNPFTVRDFIRCSEPLAGTSTTFCVATYATRSAAGYIQAADVM